MQHRQDHVSFFILFISIFLKNGPTPASILFIFVLFKHKFNRKTIVVSGIRTRIVDRSRRVEGEHADHLTTTTAHFFLCCNVRAFSCLSFFLYVFTLPCNAYRIFPSIFPYLSPIYVRRFQTKKTFYHSISFDCLSFLSCNNIFSIHQSKQRLKCFTVFTYSSTLLHSTYISWLQIGLLSAAKSRANLLPTYRSCSFNLFITIN